jgi:hypothetical protein
MKQYITLLLLALLVPAVVMAQGNYESKEREKYYDKNKRLKSFEPVNKEIVSNYYDDFFKFVEVDNYMPYNDTLVFTPYQDSVEFHSVARQFIGGVDRFQILKQGKKGEVEAFIYYDFKYVETFTGEPEIWVAYSDDNGKSWSYYYTGIVQKQPLFVKWYSTYPLINEQGDLQIEACLLRQMSSFIMPFGAPSYQLVIDGLLLTLDLRTLGKDSDSDGLTDIVEAKFRTDPNNADTDGDGIPDNLDLNPRFASKRTDKSIIFEALINGDENICGGFEDCESVLSIDERPEIHCVTDTTETILIVTDEPGLQNIQPKSYRVIILTTEEYESNLRYFENDLCRMRISPLFKVDGEKDTYIFDYGFNTWGAGYWVKKMEKGWRVVQTYMITRWRN